MIQQVPIQPHHNNRYYSADTHCTQPVECLSRRMQWHSVLRTYRSSFCFQVWYPELNDLLPERSDKRDRYPELRPHSIGTLNRSFLRRCRYGDFGQDPLVSFLLTDGDCGETCPQTPALKVTIGVNLLVRPRVCVLCSRATQRT